MTEPVPKWPADSNERDDALAKRYRDNAMFHVLVESILTVIDSFELNATAGDFRDAVDCAINLKNQPTSEPILTAFTIELNGEPQPVNCGECQRASPHPPRSDGSIWCEANSIRVFKNAFASACAKFRLKPDDRTARKCGNCRQFRPTEALKPNAAMNGNCLARAPSPFVTTDRHDASNCPMYDGAQPAAPAEPIQPERKCGTCDRWNRRGHHLRCSEPQASGFHGAVYAEDGRHCHRWKSTSEAIVTLRKKTMTKAQLKSIPQLDAAIADMERRERSCGKCIQRSSDGICAVYGQPVAEGYSTAKACENWRDHL